MWYQFGIKKFGVLPILLLVYIIKITYFQSSIYSLIIKHCKRICGSSVTHWLLIWFCGSNKPILNETYNIVEPEGDPTNSGADASALNDAFVETDSGIHNIDYFISLIKKSTNIILTDSYQVLIVCNSIAMYLFLSFRYFSAVCNHVSTKSFTSTWILRNKVVS